MSFVAFSGGVWPAIGLAPESVARSRLGARSCVFGAAIGGMGAQDVGDTAAMHHNRRNVPSERKLGLWLRTAVYQVWAHPSGSTVRGFGPLLRWELSPSWSRITLGMAWARRLALERRSLVTWIALGLYLSERAITLRAGKRCSWFRHLLRSETHRTCRNRLSSGAPRPSGKRRERSGPSTLPLPPSKTPA